MRVLLHRNWSDPSTDLMASTRARVRSEVVALDHGTDKQRLDDIELVLSELLTNAVVYAAAPLELRVIADENTIRIDVTDASPDLLPPAPPKAALEETGRGLMLADRLSDRWGWQVGQETKTVWVEFDRTN